MNNSIKPPVCVNQLVAEKVAVLGNTTLNVSTFREYKYRVLQSIKRFLSSKGLNMRVLNCMKCKGSKVEVMRSGASGDAYYSGVMACGSVWLCPVCASRISEGRRAELQEIIKANRYLLLMATITLQHHRGDKLKVLTEVLNDALRRLKAGRWWKKFVNEYHVKAYVSSLEITYSKANGWHPHKHILFFLDMKEKDLPPDKVEKLKSTLVKRYIWLINQHSRYASEYHSIDIAVGDDMVGNYIVKWGLLSEVSRASFKQGRGESVSPFQLIELYEQGEEWAGRAFLEYAQATFGKKQTTWSHRGRQALGLGRQKSDKELAEEKALPEDTLIVSISRELWRKVMRHSLYAEVLDIAESRGGDAVLEYLSGIPPDTS